MRGEQGTDIMHIRSIAASNFKSLLDFKLDFAKFTCLVGLNGAGKSTVLQLIDFLGQQARGDIRGWLRERNWSAKDLRSHFSKKKNVDFKLRLSDSCDRLCSWEGTFNTERLRCTTEHIRLGDAELHVHEGKLEVTPRDENGEDVSAETGRRPLEDSTIMFDYEGSVLSQLRESTLHKRLVEFKRHLQTIKAFDVLSPHFLRQRTRGLSDSLGLSGQGLSALLHQLGAQERESLVSQLKSVYGQLKSLDTKTLNRGWIKLDVGETFGDQQVTTDAQHVADGVLRLVALLAALRAGHRLLLFDEIENGVNPELVEFVLDTLVQAPQQVVITTHSPMILNYLDDATAREGVIYLYKTEQGCTRSIPFFSIPSLAEKLTVMGPGEAFADTNLTELAQEIESITEAR
ncbi:MAG: AAA family ATPase [Pirellulaceae bacterium]|nr:AAA family ATPase [Pirellulaceae bacterium]